MNKVLIFLFLANLAIASSFDGSASGIELSESEKYIFENRKNIKQNKKDLLRMKLKLNSIKDSVDGLKSVVESINIKIGEELQSKSKNNSIDSNELKNLEKKLEKSDKENQKRFRELEKSIAKLIKLVSGKTSISHKLKNSKKTVKKLTPKESYLKGLKLLSRKKYKEASGYFLDSASGNYKPATSYFKIAETLYFQRKFSDAIVYYKKSVDKDDKTSFMSTLMLHTGISFQKVSDKEGAKKFLDAVVGAYPESKNAQIAKKYLKKL